MRYWARMIDLYAIAVFGGFVGGIVAPESELWELHDALFTMIVMFGWVFLEPLFLTIFGTTPGKALLKTKLEKATPSRFNYTQALIRSFKVWMRGFGFGIPIISIVTLIFAYGKLRDNRETSWDREGGFVVTHDTIGVFRIMVAILILLSIIGLVILGQEFESL